MNTTNLVISKWHKMTITTTDAFSSVAAHFLSMILAFLPDENEGI